MHLPRCIVQIIPREHLNRCVERRRLLARFQCAGNALSDFAVPRVVTILALFAVFAVFAVAVSLLN